MSLKNKFTKEELELLKKINIKIEDREYNENETGELISLLDDTIRETLDENDDFTEKSYAYEKIQDKILEYEETKYK